MMRFEPVCRSNPTRASQPEHMVPAVIQTDLRLTIAGFQTLRLRESEGLRRKIICQAHHFKDHLTVLV